MSFMSVRKLKVHVLTHRWRKCPRLCCLIKKLRILPINVGRTNVQNPLDFVTALLVDGHKRGRLRHRGGAISGGIGSAIGYGFGKAVEIPLDKKINPDLTWSKYTPQPLNDKIPYVDVYRRNIVPSISGSTMSEIGNRVFQNYYTKPNEEK